MLSDQRLDVQGSSPILRTYRADSLRHKSENKPAAAVTSLPDPSASIIQVCHYHNNVTMRPPLPNFSSTVYSQPMPHNPLLILLLSTFLVETGFLFLENSSFLTQGMAWKISFFSFIPLALSLLVWLRFRWSAAVCVFYATIGLAIDIATIVQASSTEGDAVASLMAGIISGLFYFCLILFGWQSFLAVDQELRPPKFRPPNPPSPS